MSAVLGQIKMVEVACERLRANSAARSSSAQVIADLAVYVPPLSSPSKDSPVDGNVPFQTVDDAVMTWLKDTRHQVLLLHGQSGSGKSLYVKVFETCRDGQSRRLQGGTAFVARAGLSSVETTNCRGVLCHEYSGTVDDWNRTCGSRTVEGRLRILLC